MPVSQVRCNLLKRFMCKVTNVAVQVRWKLQTVFIVFNTDYIDVNVSGLGQPALGGGLTLGALASSAATTTTAAPVASLGLGGVDFSTSSEKKSDKSSGASPQ